MRKDFATLPLRHLRRLRLGHGTCTVSWRAKPLILMLHGERTLPQGRQIEVDFSPRGQGRLGALPPAGDGAPWSCAASHCFLFLCDGRGVSCLAHTFFYITWAADMSSCPPAGQCATSKPPHMAGGILAQKGICKLVPRAEEAQKPLETRSAVGAERELS